MCAPTLIYLFKLLNGQGNQMPTLPFSRGGFPGWDCPGAPGFPRGSAAAEPRGAGGRAGQREPARLGQWVGGLLGGFKGFFFYLFFFFIWMGILSFYAFTLVWVCFFVFHSQQVLQQKAGIKSMRGRSVCPGILIFSIFLFLKTRKVNSKWLLEPA